MKNLTRKMIYQKWKDHDIAKKQEKYGYLRQGV